jgi:hypothetical protein
MVYDHVAAQAVDIRALVKQLLFRTSVKLVSTIASHLSSWGHDIFS